MPKFYQMILKKENNDNANEGQMFTDVKQLINFLPKKLKDQDKYIRL